MYKISLVLIAASIGVQFLGAAVYPSGWDQRPVEIDRALYRLWDWSDSELTRCIRISKAYRAVFGPAAADAFAASALSPLNPPEQPPVAPLAGGSLDRVGCERIEGWAWDPRQPETPIAVELYDGEKLLATVIANRLRQDLVRSEKGDGRHGFVFRTPATLKDGMIHQIHAKAAVAGIELNKSPQELDCSEP